jgi:hypothetical protein
MEHLVILLVHFVLWLDTKFQKPLRRALPNYDQLLLDPRQTLAEGDVVLGPMKRYASAAGLGALLGLASWIVIFALVIDDIRRANLPTLLVGGVAGAGLILLSLAWIWLLLTLLRGGTLVLRTEGVEFRHRRIAVVCPWSVFNVAGQPFAPKADHVLLPIHPAAVPFIEAFVGGQPVSQGKQVKTKPFTVRSPTQAVLHALYLAPITEAGGLLLRLGRTIGERLPDGSRAEDALSAAAARPGPPIIIAPNGWVTIHLTRVVFPPFCCDCGRRTEQVQEFRGYTAWLRTSSTVLLETNPYVRVAVPVCGSCQLENRLGQSRAMWRGMGIAALTGLVPCLLIALVWRQPGFLVLGFGVAFLTALIGGAIGSTRGRNQHRPVEVQRYSARDGTVALRFQRREFAEAVMEVMDEPALT